MFGILEGKIPSSCFSFTLYASCSCGITVILQENRSEILVCATSCWYSASLGTGLAFIIKPNVHIKNSIAGYSLLIGKSCFVPAGSVVLQHLELRNCFNASFCGHYPTFCNYKLDIISHSEIHVYFDSEFILKDIAQQYTHLKDY